MDKEFKIKESIALAILQYLGTKPYIEVSGLIQALQTIAPAELDTVEAPKEEKEK